MRTVDPVKHQAKRRHILDAATGCFMRAGFDRTTTAEICLAAGISSGSLFHYFPSKRAIFRAIFEQDGKDAAAEIAIAAAAADPLKALLRLVDVLLKPLAEPGVATLVNEVVAQVSRDEELAVVVARNDRELTDGLAGLLTRAAARGQIDTALDPASAATWIAAIIDAAFARVSIDPGFAPAAQLPMIRLLITRFLRAEIVHKGP